MCLTTTSRASVKEKFAALTTAMRQIGVRSQGGAEALAIFHQLLYDEWVAGSLNEPLETCLMLNKKGSRQCPRIVVQSKEMLMFQECSLALGMVAAEAHGRVAAQQASGSLPWIGVDDPSDLQRLQAEHAARLQETAIFQLGGPEQLAGANNPRHLNDLDAAPPEWRIWDVQNMAKVSTVTVGSITLGVAVGRRQYITDQLLAKADVIRAMHEQFQLCQDPQTEFALLRESLGVSRVNHILRVHGHTMLQEQWAAEIYNEVGQRSLERTEESMT